jgi:hypothetical protein
MCKWQRVIPRHKGSPRYWIAHGWKNEFGSFNLETLKFLMHFRESGSSLYFIYTIHTHTSIFFFFFILIFYLLPLNSNCIVPTSSPMIRSLLVLGQRGDRDKVGTRNIFPLERYLKSSMLAPSCDLPWIDDPYSMIGCGQGGKHKRWYLVFKGRYPMRFVRSPMWGYTMHR